MIVFPDISPVAFHLGPVAVHWYGLMYLASFVLVYGLARYRTTKLGLPLDAKAIDDLIFYGAMGVIVGGRLGYMLFYSGTTFFTEPWKFFAVWQGGMSFHGGLLGVILAMFIFAKQVKLDFLQVTDFIAPFVPIGLGLGRIANFINSELWGGPTNLPWGVLFPNGGGIPRHPSQLYEALLEGVFLFVVLWWYSGKKPQIGRVSAVFLILYGVCRFVIEFVRVPDAQLGYLAWHWFTMGQLLSLPMILAGVLLWWMKR